MPSFPNAATASIHLPQCRGHADIQTEMSRLNIAEQNRQMSRQTTRPQTGFTKAWTGAFSDSLEEALSRGQCCCCSVRHAQAWLPACSVLLVNKRLVAIGRCAPIIGMWTSWCDNAAPNPCRACDMQVERDILARCITSYFSKQIFDTVCGSPYSNRTFGAFFGGGVRTFPRSEHSRRENREVPSCPL